MLKPCRKKKVISGPRHLRTWRAVSETIGLADIHQVPGNNSKELDNIVISVAKKKDKTGKLPSDFHLVPSWTVMFNGIRVQKDLLDFLTLVKDTLLEENPIIRIDYRCGGGIKTVRGRILGLVGIKGDDSQYDRHQKSHNFHFYVKLNKGKTLPKTLRGFQITITGKLLPKDIYQYAFCNTSDGRPYNCSDLDYIKNTGDIYWSYGIDRCQVFDRRKGTSKQFCSFISGT